MAERPNWRSNAPDPDDESSPPAKPLTPPARPLSSTSPKTPKLPPAALPGTPSTSESENPPSMASPSAGRPGKWSPPSPRKDDPSPRPPSPTARPSSAPPSASPSPTSSPKVPSPKATPSSLASPSAGSSGKLGGFSQARSLPKSKEEAKSQAKQVVKDTAIKSAAAGVTSVTGIPQPVAEKAIRYTTNFTSKHWRGIVAALVLLPALPIFFVIAISGSFNSPGGISSACSTAATAASLTTANSGVPAGTPPPASQVTLFLAALRWQESRDNYTDVTSTSTWDPTYNGDDNLNGASGAFGAYQYIQTTWYAYAEDAGAGAYAKENPITLSPGLLETVQDEVATWEVTTHYEQDEGNSSDTGNVWMWVAEQHFDSLYAVPSKQNFAPGNNGGETMAEYGNAVVGYMTSEPWLTSGSTTTSAPATLTSSVCGATEVSGPLASQIVQIATNEVGQTQSDGGGNWGPAGQPWCSYFASWVLDQAGVTPAPGSIGYVGDLWNWGSTSGGVQLPPTATPQPGDLVIFGTGYANHGMAHVAIVTQVLSDGDIAVVGGNEGLGSNATSTVGISTPFNPATAASNGWPAPVYGYVQPPGVATYGV
jgi:hypothetical protein